MRVALLILLLQLPLQQYQSHAKGTDKQASTNQRGTEDSPLVVKVLPAHQTDAEATQEEQWRKDQSNANWWMVRFTLAYCIVALLQLGVFGLQARRLRQTIKKMEDIAQGQTADMNKSIAEAARAATAMDKAANAAQDSANAAVQNTHALIVTQRAQLTAAPIKPIVGVVANETPRPQVHLINTGLTPAYNCIHETWVEVLPHPLTDFTTAAVYKKVEYPMTVYCNTPSPPLVEISLERQLIPKEAAAIHPWSRAEEDTPFYLCFRIRVEYQDAFSFFSPKLSRNRYIDCAFVFDGEGVGAFPKYNDSN